MLTVLLVAQILITIAMIGIIMIQRSASDGLSGIGGGASGGGGLMSGRATATALTRATAFLAILFMANALTMATITARSGLAKTSIAEAVSDAATATESENPSLNVPLAPTDGTTPTATPSVPVAE